MSTDTPVTISTIKEHIQDIDVGQEMEESFLEYAYSVIYARALPDARDGLKPVQRRILYTMDQMNLTPDKGYVKSSRVVGEVMGKYHPHGDSAIYDAMVRMAQGFSLRLPLIDGHGNFGSLDDGPAASRYTEVRLNSAALEMTANLHEETVSFVPNYDNQLMQPVVLPAAIPNLLVNGTSGIAVGMATNMAPHNLIEVIEGIKYLIKNPDVDLDKIMEFIPGPDLPTGGSILGNEGIHTAYATGRGSFKMRAKVDVESVTARKKGLIVTELPYLVGPEKITEKIKEGVDKKKIQGISDVVDLSDRKNPLRLQIEVKTGFNPEAVLQQLYKHTPLEESFAINNVALVDGQPHTLGLLDLLKVYLAHRTNVVRRRTQYRLRKKQERLHLVEGLLIAVVDIDEVIQIIRSSESSKEAKARLIQIFELSDVQAEHILELRLRQLTKYSQLELEKEQQDLLDAITELESILASDHKLAMLIHDELDEVSTKHGNPRQTILLDNDTAQEITARSRSTQSPENLEIADLPCYVVMTADGRIGRTANTTVISPPQRTTHDSFVSFLQTTARGSFAAVTTQGKMLKSSVLDLPVISDTEGTLSLDASMTGDEFFSGSIGSEDTVISCVSLTTPLALGTAQGVVKRVTPEYPSTVDQWDIISLKENDHLVGAAHCADTDHMVFMSSGDQLLHYKASAVRPQGRTGGGMAGMKLKSDTDQIIFFGVIDPLSPQANVATIAAGTHSAKLSSLNEFPTKGRATGGVRAQRLLKDETTLSHGWAGYGTVMALSSTGKHVPFPQELVKRDMSGTPLSQKVSFLGSTVDVFRKM